MTTTQDLSMNVHDTFSAYVINRTLVANNLKPSLAMAILRHNDIPLPVRSIRRTACTGRVDRTAGDVPIRIF